MRLVDARLHIWSSGKPTNEGWGPLSAPPPGQPIAIGCPGDPVAPFMRSGENT